MSKPMSNEWYIEKIKASREDKGEYYGFDTIDYKGMGHNIELRCPDCNNLFTISPQSYVYNNSGCLDCARIRCAKERRYTTDDYMSLLKIKRKDCGEFYDYSKLDYQDMKSNILVICPIHNEVFSISADTHLHKDGGCTKCASVITTGYTTSNKEEYLAKLSILRDDKGLYYGYDKVVYTLAKNKIEIWCPECEEYFWQSANNHRGRNHGCPICADRKNGDNQRYTQEKFVELLSEREDKGEVYDYSNSKYKGMMLNIEIYCNVCDKYFEQTVENHIHRNQNCPTCQPKHSKGVRETIEYLDENDIYFIMEHRYDDCRDILPLPFDFYLPDYDVLIEYDGKQHYKARSSWGGEKALASTQYHDSIKNEYCLANDIPLIRIKYTITDIPTYLDDYLSPLL